MIRDQILNYLESLLNSAAYRQMTNSQDNLMLDSKENCGKEYEQAVSDYEFVSKVMYFVQTYQITPNGKTILDGDVSEALDEFKHHLDPVFKSAEEIGIRNINKMSTEDLLEEISKRK